MMMMHRAAARLGATLFSAAVRPPSPCLRAGRQAAASDGALLGARGFCGQLGSGAIPRGRSASAPFAFAASLAASGALVASAALADAASEPGEGWIK